MSGVDAAQAVASPSAPWRVHVARLLSSPGRRRVLGIVALAVAYRGAAEIGYTLQFAGAVAAIVWLPVGVGIAFLYLAGLRYWPGILIGDLLANSYETLPLGSAIGQTCGNVLEVVVATVLLRRLVPAGDPLSSVGGLGGLLAAIGAGTAISATIGPLSLLIGGVISADDLARVARTWWLGDLSGALLVLPLVLAWATPPPRAWWRRHGPELLLLLATVAALSVVAFRTSRPLTYLVFPALIWAALRLRQRGATAAVAVAAGFAIWETTRRVGPFAYGSATHSVLNAQLYLTVSALSTFFLAAVVSEREAFAASLAESRARLVTTAADERRRIERNLHDGAQQRLAALLIRLRLVREYADEPERPLRALRDAEGELASAIRELRELAHGILPSILAQEGLAGALAEIARDSSVPIRLLGVPETRVDATAEVTAYFVVSEAVANAQKHADATSIAIRATAARGLLCVEVVDDGRGGASERTGSGLQGLRDRVEAIGGRFALDSDRGRGTRVVARLPMPVADGDGTGPRRSSEPGGAPARQSAPLSASDVIPHEA